MGTVGRIRSLINDNYLDLSKVKSLCFDEADRLFTQSENSNELKFICSKLQANSKLLCYSATFPQEIRTKLCKLINIGEEIPIFIDCLSG